MHPPGPNAEQVPEASEAEVRPAVPPAEPPGWRRLLRWLGIDVLGQTLLLLLATSLIVGLFLYHAPGRIDTTLPIRHVAATDPATPTAPVTPPPPARGFARFYLQWLGALVTGELGRSTHGFSVADELQERWPATAALTLGSLLLVALLALGTALLSTTRPNRLFTRLGTGGLYLLTALPAFFLAYLLAAVFPFQLAGPTRYLLPILVLACADGLASELSRLLAGSLREELAQPYVETARVKGLRPDACWPWPGTVLFHAFRQAILHVLPRSPLHFAQLVGLSLLVEKIFAIDGLGGMLLDGLGERDVHRVMVVVLLLTLLVRGLNLASDGLQLLLNPRRWTAA